MSQGPRTSSYQRPTVAERRVPIGFVQMPRGNTETVFPRALVLAAIRTALDRWVRVRGGRTGRWSDGPIRRKDRAQVITGQAWHSIGGPRAVLSRLDYGRAFELARTHRIDLNLLHDHQPSRFFASTAALLDAVIDPERLNLFLSTLRCA